MNFGGAQLEMLDYLEYSRWYALITPPHNLVLAIVTEVLGELSLCHRLLTSRMGDSTQLCQWHDECSLPGHSCAVPWFLSLYRLSPTHIHPNEANAHTWKDVCHTGSRATHHGGLGERSVFRWCPKHLNLAIAWFHTGPSVKISDSDVSIVLRLDITLFTSQSRIRYAWHW